jgi:hypothetical protein
MVINMFKIRVLILALVSSSIVTLAGCGDAIAPATPVASSDASRSVAEKAPGDPVPVYRFAKISNGAYFYTANQAEFEEVNANYPDFRFEGVAFQAAATGGTPVFRYAKTDTGAYFYTTSVEERAYIAANFPNFRDEGAVFNVPTAGSPMYRLANLANGAYLYTASLEEYNYAQTVGFRGEGEKFQVPGGLVLSGTVYKEMPWAQARVKVIDVNGVTKTGVTSNLGGYSVDITGMTAPIFVVASHKTPGAISEYMMGSVPSLPSNATATTLNVTPLTDLVHRYANEQEPNFLVTGPVLARTLRPVDVDAANTAIRKILAAQIGANGLSASNYDATKLPFAANTSGQAALLRDISVNVFGDSGSAWVSNKLTGNLPAASVLVDSDLIRLNTVAVLPPATKLPFPQAKLDSIKTAWNACLAVPAASRVTIVNDVATSIHPTCAAIAGPSYNLNSESFAQRWRAILSEPSFVSGSMESVLLRDYADIDGKELAGVYLRGLSNDGKPFNSLDVLTKTTNGWELVGNGRPYLGSGNARLNRYVRLANGASTPIERYRSDVQFFFDPSQPSMANIRAVRVKGAGLPAAGIVYMRSNVCGTSDYMAIQNRDGIVVDTNTAGAITNDRVWTGNSSPTFNFSELFVTGSGTWPTLNRNFADTNLDFPGALIPPGSRYTMEYFAFEATPSTTPVATYTTTLNGTVMNVRDGSNLQDIFAAKSAYPTAAFIADFISPTGAGAGPRVTTTPSWSTLGYAGNVTTVFAYSSARNLAQTDTTLVDAYFVAQGGTTPWITSGGTSTTLTFNNFDLTNGTSTHPTTVARATPNPTCAAMPVQFRGLTENTGYREITIRSSTSNFTRMQTLVGIQN